jgi:excisionase family DNA binding protein
MLDTYRLFVGADANAGPTVNIAAAAERRPDGVQLLTVPQAAEALGHSRRTVERWIASGQLRAVRVGSRHPWRVPVGHPRMERPPPRRTLPRRDVPDHRRTHRLPRPLEPDLDTYPLRSLVLELDEEAVH